MTTTVSKHTPFNWSYNATFDPKERIETLENQNNKLQEELEMMRNEMTGLVIELRCKEMELQNLRSRKRTKL